ncbi:hypothetical protein N0V92_013727 [Colletotrichum tropicale]|nr:hypothetical protein N0V92_013727 [Colletotrichum tropicale]
MVAFDISPKGQGGTLKTLLLGTITLCGAVVGAGTNTGNTQRGGVMSVNDFTNGELDLNEFIAGQVMAGNRKVPAEFAGVDLNLTHHIEPANNKSVDKVDWNNPPMWAIRPEDRAAFLAGGPSALSLPKRPNHEGDITPPCEDNQSHKLYYTYYEIDCPAKLHTDGKRIATSSSGACEKWNEFNDHLECASFCQAETTFEWAEERPFPHSDCHYPIACGITESDSTSYSWGISLKPKLAWIKALKFGVSGGYHQSQSTSTGRKFDIELNEEKKCGYFTWVPIKKTVCGVLSESKPGLKTKWVMTDDGYLEVGYCDVSEGPGTEEDPEAVTDGNYCTSMPWYIQTPSKKMVPDGTVLFVYTDCNDRSPLPMEQQDPIYAKSGVALHSLTVRALHDSWIKNFCRFEKNIPWFDPATGKTDKYKTLYLLGTGFSDNQIGGEDGKGLIEKITACAKGDIKEVAFGWIDFGHPDDDNELRGAYWSLRARMPKTMDGGCVGDVLMDIGGTTVDRCGDGS